MLALFHDSFVTGMHFATGALLIGAIIFWIIAALIMKKSVIR